MCVCICFHSALLRWFPHITQRHQEAQLNKVTEHSNSKNIKCAQTLLHASAVSVAEMLLIVSQVIKKIFWLFPTTATVQQGPK